MKEYKISIELLSDLLIGSGEGFGTLIDTDIIFDNYGIPYIPSKRIKGCIKDSFKEVIDSYKKFIDTTILEAQKLELEDNIFGNGSKNIKGCVFFDNLYLNGYEEHKLNQEWLEYFTKNSDPDFKLNYMFGKERITNALTSIRKQTKINDLGVAEEGSLRSIRVISKNNEVKFIGKIVFNKENQQILNLINVCVKNLKNIGTMRNRGFGYIKCTIEDLESNEVKK